MIASDLRDTANDLARSARIRRCVKTDDFISKSDLRKLVEEYRTKQHLSDKPRGVNNLLDDIENLLDGGKQ